MRPIARTIAATLVVATAATLPGGPAHAKGGGKATLYNPRDYGQQAPEPERQDASSFTAEERGEIVRYFKTHQWPLATSVPVKRGEALPAGAARQPLPDGLVARLPTRTDYERAVVGHDVVLLESDGTVRDVLYFVLP